MVLYYKTHTYYIILYKVCFPNLDGHLPISYDVTSLNDFENGDVAKSLKV
jgi:hypothetical protein